MKYDFKRLVEETAWIEGSFVRKYHESNRPSKVDEFEVSDAQRIVKKPLVSYCVLVYNKKEFLRECVDSILSQDAPCSFEIILSEDESTDGSRELCFELQREHPDVIRVVYAAENVGVLQNHLRALSRVRGEFIACVDGDDYFCSKSTLRRQVEFLRQHDEYSMVYTAFYTQCETHKITRVPISYRTIRKCVEMECAKNPLAMARSLLRHNPIAASSTLIRKCDMGGFADWIDCLSKYMRWFPSQDFETWFYVATRGLAHFDCEFSEVYRHNAGALTSAAIDVANARKLGDIRNKIAIVAHEGEKLFDEKEQDYWVDVFLHQVANCLALLPEETTRMKCAEMRYAVELSEKSGLFNEDHLREQRKKMLLPKRVKYGSLFRRALRGFCMRMLNACMLMTYRGVEG